MPPAGIIWLASFPKSGSTWFRAFLANLDAGEKGPVDINELDALGSITASSRFEFEAATLLDSGLLPVDDIERLRPRVHEWRSAQVSGQRWIKVHDAYTSTSDGEPLLGRRTALKAVYVVRDPRDVAVSFSHHNDTSVDDAIGLMCSSDGLLSRGRVAPRSQLMQRLKGWGGHVASWLDQTDVPVHAVRYEDLVADPVARFTAALAFVQREATTAEIERASRHASFDELSWQESERGFAERVSQGSAFFRSGRVGVWRDVLSPAQAARIESAFDRQMRRLGYAVTS